MSHALTGVIRTGTANLASVVAAFQRMGAETRVVEGPRDLVGVGRLVLPGVGAFGAAMTQLRQHGLDRAVKEQVRSGAPFLAICLGLQLLAEGSDESPGVRGLGIVPGRARRLPDSVRVPQLGWNRVEWSDGTAPIVAWYANSYCLTAMDAGWEVAHTTHGDRFIAAIRRPRQLACQFHPELSGAAGARLLREWWATC
jgi:imidazole glycerol phosphate synthase glutamine amidotransferase subunit